MSGDPAAVEAALERAATAFERAGTLEEGLRDVDEDLAQLRKGCRLLAAAQTLQAQGGYHTAVVELSFGAVERSFEFYAITVADDEGREFTTHSHAYERGAKLNVISQEMRDEFLGLYFQNRAASYDADRAVTAEEATAMLDLASITHEYLRDRPREHYECPCD